MILLTLIPAGVRPACRTGPGSQLDRMILLTLIPAGVRPACRAGSVTQLDRMILLTLIPAAPAGAAYFRKFPLNRFCCLCDDNPVFSR
jgi:hypothetical protein